VIAAEAGHEIGKHFFRTGLAPLGRGGDAARQRMAVPQANKSEESAGEKANYS
jgi:hypothetical protein